MALVFNSASEVTTNDSVVNTMFYWVCKTLKDAGWTFEGGYNHVGPTTYTAGNPPGSVPVTSMTDTVNTDYLRAVFTMNDSLSGTSPYTVGFLIREGANASNAQWFFEIGTGVSGSGSTIWVSGSLGRTFGMTAANNAYPGIGYEMFFSAYESGMMMKIGSNNVSDATHYAICIERGRTMAGAITNDILAYVPHNGNTWIGYGVANPGSGVALTTTTMGSGASVWGYRHSGGVYTQEFGTMVTLYANQAWSASCHPTLAAVIASDTVITIGPYLLAGNQALYGRPRLVTVIPHGTLSTRPNTNITAMQDGVSRTFVAGMATGASGQYIAAATAIFAKT